MSLMFLGLLVLAWFAAATASADMASETDSAAPSTWRLLIASDSACANDPTFREALEETVPAPRRPATGPVDFLAEITIDSWGRGQIRVLDQGRRSEAGARTITLPGGDCSSAGEAIAFVLGVLVQTEYSVAPSPVERAAEPPPAPPPAAPPPPPPVRRRSGRYSWLGPAPGHDVGVAVGTSLGLLPGVPVVGNAYWAIRPHRAWPVVLSVGGGLNVTTHALDAKFRAIYGGVAVCPLHWQNERARVRLCPGVAAGAMWAHAQRLPNSRRQVRPVGFVNTEATIGLHVTGTLFFDLGVRVEAALPRRDFIYYRSDGATPAIHHTQWVNGTAFGGLSVRFR